AIEVANGNRDGLLGGGVVQRRSERAVAVAQQDTDVVREGVGNDQVGEAIVVKVTYGHGERLHAGGRGRVRRRLERAVAVAQEDTHGAVAVGDRDVRDGIAVQVRDSHR